MHVVTRVALNGPTVRALAHLGRWPLPVVHATTLGILSRVQGLREARRANLLPRGLLGKLSLRIRCVQLHAIFEHAPHRGLRWVVVPRPLRVLIFLCFALGAVAFLELPVNLVEKALGV